MSDNRKDILVLAHSTFFYSNEAIFIKKVHFKQWGGYGSFVQQNWANCRMLN